MPATPGQWGSTTSSQPDDGWMLGDGRSFHGSGFVSTPPTETMKFAGRMTFVGDEEKARIVHRLGCGCRADGAARAVVAGRGQREG